MRRRRRNCQRGKKREGNGGERPSRTRRLWLQGVLQGPGQPIRSRGWLQANTSGRIKQRERHTVLGLINPHIEDLKGSDI